MASGWLDASGYLEVKRPQPGNAGGSLQAFDMVSSDYREVDGVRMAHRIEIAAPGGKNRIVVVVDAFKFNTPLEPARFSMPRATP